MGMCLFARDFVRLYNGGEAATPKNHAILARLGN